MPRAGELNHAACVFAQGRIFPYLNAVLGDARDGPSSARENTGPTFIGANAPAGGDHFDGLLDDVRVYGRALSQDTIAAHAR